LDRIFRSETIKFSELSPQEIFPGIVYFWRLFYLCIFEIQIYKHLDLTTCLFSWFHAESCFTNLTDLALSPNTPPETSSQIPQNRKILNFPQPIAHHRTTKQGRLRSGQVGKGPDRIFKYFHCGGYCSQVYH